MLRRTKDKYFKDDIEISEAEYNAILSKLPKPEEQKAPTEEEIKKAEYKTRVENLIRGKYSVSDEIAIIRQRYTKPKEFDEYFAFVEACKELAKGL